ncbi:MAG: hypothetical protein HY961_09015 [Ignavibacteriae bacterium]|nr:hypothetical protein [Ignavibacteriota bacterium]
MRVGELLKKVVSSTGLIVFADATNIPEVDVIQTRTISLQALLAETKGLTSGESAPERSVSFEKIFETMNVPAFAHGWSAKSVATYMQSEDIARLSKREAKEALVRVLHENKIPLEDILTDAVNRDRALDVYEEFVQKKLRERTIKRDNEIASLEQKIGVIEEHMRELKKQQKNDADEYEDWLKKKIDEEEQLVKAVAIITDENKISVGSINNRKETK